MSDVFKEHYEIVGTDALVKARAFAAHRQAAHDAQWAVVQELGAEGYRPASDGTVKSLLFPKAPKAPDGWRKIGTDQGRMECRPSLNTKIGNAAARKLAGVERCPDWRSLADQFGWKGRSPMGESRGGRLGMAIYFATGVHLLKPSERFFLQLPRTLDDGWNAPDGLAQVRESDFLRAIEDHNIAARAARAEAA